MIFEILSNIHLRCYNTRVIKNANNIFGWAEGVQRWHSV